MNDTISGTIWNARSALEQSRRLYLELPKGLLEPREALWNRAAGSTWNARRATGTREALWNRAAGSTWNARRATGTREAHLEQSRRLYVERPKGYWNARSALEQSRRLYVERPQGYWNRAKRIYSSTSRMALSTSAMLMGLVRWPFICASMIR